MRVIPVTVYPHEGGYDSPAEAIAAAEAHPLQTQARFDTQSLSGATLLDFWWTDTDYLIRFSNKLFLHVYVTGPAVGWSIVGFIEKRGKRLHNSAAILHRGKLLGVHRKSVPGSPHEREVVTYLSDFRVFRVRGVTFGVLICYEGALLEPALLLAERGARIIFEPHYSYIAMEHMDWQRQRVRISRTARAVENACWYVKANTVTEPMRKLGDAEGFGYGDSFILDTIGRPRAEAGLFTAGWITADVPRRELTAARESRVRMAPPATRQQVARLYGRA